MQDEMPMYNKVPVRARGRGNMEKRDLEKRDLERV